MTARQRFHDETATGALCDPSTAPKARVSYGAAYYDLGNRLTDSVDVGTNGGAAWTRPSSAPARSDTVLVASYGYNSAGWLESVTDPRGIVGKTFYDNLGQVTKTVEAYVDGTPSAADDKTTEFTYDGSGNLLTLTARLPGTAYQTTQYLYGVTTATGSGVNSNDLLSAVRHPDKATGSPSASEQETVTVNALGETRTATDRNGNVHAYGYDVLSRLTSDAVTTLGTGVDGSVRRLEVAYDTQGNPYLFTSYDAATAGNVVSQVQDAFNGLGQLTAEYQAHSGVVNTGTTPKVQYAYTEMAAGANHSRPTSLTYPNGRVLNYNYATGLDNNVSRLTSLSDTSATLESYAYLGLGTVVRRAHPQPGVDLSYIKQSGEANGDAGDPYTGLDRFGRVDDQRWLTTSTGTAVDRYQYGYDRDSNRLYRSNVVNTSFSELYSYDSLNQLTGFQRGTLSDGNGDGVPDTVASPSRSQSWSLDAMGNWSSITTDGTTQTRSHNQQNEVTGIGGSSLTFDANGNLTTDETGKQLVYDAWNRLVQVKTSGGSTLATYRYDALDRRIVETSGGTTRDLYYSADWQVLEERVSGQAQTQYVWRPEYVDELVERDRDTNGDGTLEERLYALQDANWNVTALVDTSGAVVERYAYDPYGQMTVLAPDWSTRSSSTYAWVYTFQTGRYDSPTGLYGVRERDYSPSEGRWLEPDPIGFAGGANLYGFAGDGPTNATDPSGLKPLIERPTSRLLRMLGLQKAAPVLMVVEFAIPVVELIDAPADLVNLAYAGGVQAWTAGGKVAQGDFSGAGRSNLAFVLGLGLELARPATAQLSRDPLSLRGLEALRAFGGLGNPRAPLPEGDYLGDYLQGLIDQLDPEAAERGRDAAPGAMLVAMFVAGNVLNALEGEGCPTPAEGEGAPAPRRRGVCFPAGTPVHSAAGLKPIEQVAVGDRVWSYDHRQLRWAQREVVEVFKPLHQGTMATVRVQGETIRATGGHPFWVVRGEGLAERPRPVRIAAYEAGGRQEGRWVLGRDLRAGDEVLLRPSEVVPLESVRLDEVEEPVYNFHVAELQNYAVGGCGVLVHNTNDPSGPRRVPNPDGRNGTPAHQADVAANNNQATGRLRPRAVGGRVPDGVGRPGQVVKIRGQRIDPGPNGRVIVESEPFRNGRPVSGGRRQIRDIRAAAPNDTIVVTDPNNPRAAPLIYPPGTQPPPGGWLPRGTPPSVPYP